MACSKGELSVKRRPTRSGKKLGLWREWLCSGRPLLLSKEQEDKLRAARKLLRGKRSICLTRDAPRHDSDTLHNIVILRAQSHIQTLLGLISTFPTDNPTPAPGDEPSDAPHSDTLKPNEEPDLAVLLERIRARYKLLCSSLGVRPRLAVASNPEDTASNGAIESSGIETATVRGAEGSGVARGMIEGVDTRLLRF